MKLKLHALAALAAIAISLFGAPTNANAQVIEDQIGSNYEHDFPHLGIRSSFQGGNAYTLPATRRVTPVGGLLSELSVLGSGADIDGTRNMTTEEWMSMDFHVFVYANTSQFLDDPMNYTATKFFDTPSNGDWLTSVGNFNGFSRYLFKFDLESMGVSVNPGQDIAIAFAGSTANPVNWRVAFSNGQGFGPEGDLIAFDDGLTRYQDTLENRNAPSDWVATRIAVVPEPGTCIALGVGVAYLLRRKRRSLG